jgi:uncharacterized protein YjdB
MKRIRKIMDFRFSIFDFRLAGAILALVALNASAVPEPAGWFNGDIHVHRSCGGAPDSVSSIFNTAVSRDMNVISLCADMGNGEVQNPATDLPLVNGTDASISTPGRILHWDTEWHWDATYSQYPHQALGGHIMSLGLSSASQVWSEMTSTIFNWAHQRGAIAGFAHFQYLDDNVPTSLTCCTPIEYPVEVALGACDFISEDVNGSDVFLHHYYRLLNCGFRPGFAAGSDRPCAADIGTMLTYSQCAGGTLTYRNWLDGIKNGRTVVSRNGRLEFVDLKVNGTSGPGDEIKLTGGGNVTVNIQWTAAQNLNGSLELVQNGAVIASKTATATVSSPVSLTATVNFTKSGWLCARRMGANGHTVHTAAVFVTVDNKPVRTSASDAQFYVSWMDMLLQNTSAGGAWASFFPTTRTAAQARFSQAKAIFQQIVADAGGVQAPPPAVIGNSIDGGSQDNIWDSGAWINAERFQAASNATMATIYAKVGTILGRYKCAVYAGTATTPGALLGSTAEIAGAQDGWQAFPLTTSVGLNSGSYYWLAVWSDDANAKVYYSDSAGLLRWGPYNYGNWPSPITTTGGGTLKYCIYGAAATGPVTLTSISMTPANPTLVTGGSQQFTATGTYSNGGTSNLTSVATWSSSNPSAASVNASGLASALSAGTSTISATLGSVSGGTLLTVQAPKTLTSITVTPANPTIFTGTTQQFTATGTYSDGSTANLTSTATWNSATPAVASVNGSGLASALSTGTSTISATVGSVSGGTLLTVQAPKTLTSIAVTPTNPSIVAGSTQQFAATGTYSDATTANLTSQATWASSKTAVATVSVAGLASGVSAGTATISATVGSVSGGTTLTVQAAPLVITTSTFPTGVVNTAYSAALSTTGGTTPFNWSITAGGLPTGLTLNASSGAITGTPTAAGTFNFTVNVTDAGNPVQNVSKLFSITINAQATLVTLWPSSTVPGTVDGGPDSAVELGVKFKSDVAGKITGIRFYKASSNTGTHVANLWSSTGTKLATATFNAETASGWQQVNFTTPVTITANTTYVASYHCNTGHYSEDDGYFATARDNAPLHALANGTSVNGVYRYGTSSAFPNSTWQMANYWVDVIFTP